LIGWLPSSAAAQSKQLASDKERLETRKAAEEAWLEPCKRSLRGLAARIAPICAGAVVKEDERMDPLFEAVSRRARCGLGVHVDWFKTGQPAWKTNSSVFFPGWESVERTRFGLALEVAARGTPKARKALLAIGKSMAEACTVPADDGYREYRLTVVRENQTGQCIHAGSRVGRETLVIHTQTAVLEYEYGHGGHNTALLHYDGKRWTTETTFTLESGLLGCGPAVDCVHLLGSRTIRWHLDWNEESLTAELATFDFGHFVKETDENAACRVDVGLRGALVPQ
jgi:hypothetical protein